VQQTIEVSADIDRSGTVQTDDTRVQQHAKINNWSQNGLMKEP